MNADVASLVAFVTILTCIVLVSGAFLGVAMTVARHVWDRWRQR